MVADEILFDPTVFNTPQTTTLTQGELVITEAVTIDALGQNITINASGNDNDVNVDDGGGSRVFNIVLLNFPSTQEVLLSGLTIVGSDVNGNGGAVSFNTNPNSRRVGDSPTLNALNGR